MIDRVAVGVVSSPPSWTRNVISGQNHNNNNNNSSINSLNTSNNLSVPPSGNNTSNGLQMSPGSSSVLTMESMDSLEGFDSSATESGFIATRPSMADFMAAVPNLNNGGGMVGGNAEGQLSSPGGHMAPMTLTSVPVHPHNMSPGHPTTPSNLYCNNPNTPVSAGNPSSINPSNDGTILYLLSY